MGRRTKTVAAEGIERFALAELMLRCRSGNRQCPRNIGRMRPPDAPSNYCSTNFDSRWRKMAHRVSL